MHEGDLASMSTLNSKAPNVDIIADGHALRWTKQLALRGRARLYDETGLCGKQRLVVGSDLKKFMANVDRLFPGAKVRTECAATDSAPLMDRVLSALNKAEQRELTSKDLSKLIRKPWRSVSHNVLTSEFLAIIGARGWRYVPTKGRAGARFERRPAN